MGKSITKFELKRQRKPT